MDSCGLLIVTLPVLQCLTRVLPWHLAKDAPSPLCQDAVLANGKPLVASTGTGYFLYCPNTVFTRVLSLLND